MSVTCLLILCLIAEFFQGHCERHVQRKGKIVNLSRLRRKGSIRVSFLGQGTHPGNCECIQRSACFSHRLLMANVLTCLTTFLDGNGSRRAFWWLHHRSVRSFPMPSNSTTNLVLLRFGWRWAFLMQVPLFLVSFSMTSYNLNYVTPVRFFS